MDDLTDMMKQLAALEPTVRLGLQAATDQIADNHQDISTVFTTLNDHQKRLAQLEQWRAEESGRRLASGSAWALVRWGLGFLLAGGSALIGYMAGG